MDVKITILKIMDLSLNLSGAARESESDESISESSEYTSEDGSFPFHFYFTKYSRFLFLLFIFF